MAVLFLLQQGGGRVLLPGVFVEALEVVEWGQVQTLHRERAPRALVHLESWGEFGIPDPHSQSPFPGPAGPEGQAAPALPMVLCWAVCAILPPAPHGQKFYFWVQSEWGDPGSWGLPPEGRRCISAPCRTLFPNQQCGLRMLGRPGKERRGQGEEGIGVSSEECPLCLRPCRCHS